MPICRCGSVGSVYAFQETTHEGCGWWPTPAMEELQDETMTQDNTRQQQPRAGEGNRRETDNIMSARMFFVKRRRNLGRGYYKPGALKARFWRRWLAYQSRSDARALARATAHNRQREASG